MTPRVSDERLLARLISIRPALRGNQLALSAVDTAIKTIAARISGDRT